MSKKKYLKATGLYTIGNIFNKAMSLLLLPIFTRLLSTSSYGVVSTYNSWVNMVAIIIGLQLYLTLRSAYSDYKDDLYSYVSCIDSLSLIATMILLTVAVIVLNFVHVDLPAQLVIICIIHAFFSSILNVELQRQMMALDYVKRTLLLALPGLIAALIGIVILVVFPQTDYMGRIVSNAAVCSCVGAMILFKHYKKGKTFLKSEYCRYGLGLAVPLIFHGMASEILSSVDRTMITAFKATSETGIYSVAYTMGMAVKVITASVESVWIPWFTSKINEGKNQEINKTAKYYLYIVSTLCISTMLCLPEILKLFADRSYWDGIYIIPPIVLASFIIFLYSISVDVEYYYRATKGIAVNTFIAAGLNLILNFLFIPRFGAIAAAYTTVASYAVSFCIHYAKARKLNRELYPLRMYAIPIAMAVGGTVVAYLTMDLPIIRWVISIVFLTLVTLYIGRTSGITIKT